MKTKFIFLSLFIFSIFTSCDKDDDETEQPQTNINGGGMTDPKTDANPTGISFTDMDGAIYATTWIDTRTNPTGFYSTAVALFPDGDNYLDAGTVTVKGVDLTKNTDNIYETDSNSVVFSSGSSVGWSVTGGNGIPAFTESMTRGDWPSLGSVRSDTIVSKSAGYELKTTSISRADSVIFRVGNVTKVLGGGSRSYDFTSQELSLLPNGVSTASITAYSFYSLDKGGKKIYFVKQNISIRRIRIQD